MTTEPTGDERDRRVDSESRRPDEEATAENADERRPDAHLRDVQAGAGCTEIWEHLAEAREE
ncbi:hypothetical protein [Halovivax gelatinilyticus]|uniref:hypothetical protein n=1 Tax=Halovivax gelatinilyticus TaxID=2961597 RepID=UPI0020CA3214|nr:hypothetical protein [Halovivax gelatinilyticus]